MTEHEFEFDDFLVDTPLFRAVNLTRDSSTGRIGDWMQTYTHRQFWPFDPRSEEISITDIAHGLSNTCRYNGHTQPFYSVAQHSVLVSQNCSLKNRKWALLHDAAEAYIGDMIRPMKKYFPLFIEIETRIMECVCKKYGLPLEIPAEVSEMDNRILLNERRDLGFKDVPQWNITGKPLPIPPIEALTPEESYNFFMMSWDLVYYEEDMR
jgi:hypothetical protein